MAIARETITGTTPQDINKINKNMEQMWFKVFGNLEMSDTTSEFIKNVMTQWIPVQGEGNFDSNNPYRLRFFIPPNTKSITETSFNIQIERYRMDSTVTAGGGRVVGVDIKMSMGNASGSASSVAGGGYSSGITTSTQDSHRHIMFAKQSASGMYNSEHSYGFSSSYGGSFNARIPLKVYGNSINVTSPDYIYTYGAEGGHSHGFSISIPAHSHSISMSPHTHSASGKLDLPDHTHDLTEGIKLASVAPSNVVIKLNGTSVATLNGDNAVKNELDISQHINIGQWNTIECTTSNLARINIYGVIELVQKFNVFK